MVSQFRFINEGEGSPKKDWLPKKQTKNGENPILIPFRPYIAALEQGNSIISKDELLKHVKYAARSSILLDSAQTFNQKAMADFYEFEGKLTDFFEKHNIKDVRPFIIPQMHSSAFMFMEAENNHRLVPPENLVLELKNGLGQKHLDYFVDHAVSYAVEQRLLANLGFKGGLAKMEREYPMAKFVVSEPITLKHIKELIPIMMLTMRHAQQDQMTKRMNEGQKGESPEIKVEPEPDGQGFNFVYEGNFSPEEIKGDMLAKDLRVFLDLTPHWRVSMSIQGNQRKIFIKLNA